MSKEEKPPIDAKSLEPNFTSINDSSELSNNPNTAKNIASLETEVIDDTSLQTPEEQPAIDPGMIFSTKRPKNAFHGGLSAVSNVVTGAVGGAALMVGAPVAGLYD